MRRLLFLLLFCFAFSISSFAAEYTGQLNDIYLQVHSTANNFSTMLEWLGRDTSHIAGIDSIVRGWDLGNKLTSLVSYDEDFLGLLNSLLLDTYPIKMDVASINSKLSTMSDHDYSSYLSLANDRLANLSYIYDQIGPNDTYGSVLFNLDSIDDKLTSIDDKLSELSLSEISELLSSILSQFDMHLSDIEESYRTRLDELVGIVDSYRDYYSGLTDLLSSIDSKLDDFSCNYDDDSWSDFRNVFLSSDYRSPDAKLSFYYYYSKSDKWSEANIYSRTGLSFHNFLVYSFYDFLRCNTQIANSIYGLHVDLEKISDYLSSTNSVAGFQWLQDDDLLHTTLFNHFDSSVTNSSSDNFFDFTAAQLVSILARLNPVDNSDYKNDVNSQASSINPDSIKGSMNIPERVSFLEDASDRFDYSTVLSVYNSSYMPAAITLRIPGVFGFDEQVVSIPTDSIAPFCEVSRTCFTILYWCLVGGLVFFAFKFFIPAVKFFVNILSKVMVW